MYTARYKHASYLFLLGFLLIIICTVNGCSQDKNAKHEGAPRDSTPHVLTPEATQISTDGNDVVTLDISNTSLGYIIVNYSGSNEKVKLQLVTPDGVEYTYLVNERNAFTVYPLSGGDGSYTANLLESIPDQQDMYSISFTMNFDVTLENEFLPYLYPNHYVNFSADSNLVSKGQELAEGCYSDLEVVTNIYNYVTENISYDDEKAKDVPYGYTPDPDQTLADKTGICFDYASLMSAMLRSQNIPTRLETGYSGEVYHAWISVYLEDQGWVDNIIEINGNTWSLMDPTLAASNSDDAVKKYVGDGNNYTLKYTY